METLMRLGPYKFSMPTASYQNLTRRTEYRWASVERIGRHPAMQNIGEGHTSFTLDGIIYPHHKVAGGSVAGLGQMDALRAIAGLGVPLQLVGGTGRVFGPFCVMTIDETQSYFFANGTPRKIEFALELKSYGPDGLGGFL